LIEFIPSYNDLCTEIEMLKLRIEDIETEREYLLKSMYDNAPIDNLGAVDHSKDYVQNGYVPMTLDKIVDRLNTIDKSMSDLYRIKEAKEDTKQTIEKMFDDLEGLEYKVAYMRDVRKMRLQDIADELGYSYDHIRRISSMVKMPQ